MDNRYFYIKDIDWTITVEFATRKELLSWLDEYVNNIKMCDEMYANGNPNWKMFNFEDETYCILYKDGTCDYIASDYDGHKIKRIGIASIVYSNPNTYVVYGNFEVSDNGNVEPSFEFAIDENNIVECESENYTETADTTETAETTETTKTENEPTKKCGNMEIPVRIFNRVNEYFANKETSTETADTTELFDKIDVSNFTFELIYYLTHSDLIDEYFKYITLNELFVLPDSAQSERMYYRLYTKFLEKNLTNDDIIEKAKHLTYFNDMLSEIISDSIEKYIKDNNYIFDDDDFTTTFTALIDMSCNEFVHFCVIIEDKTDIVDIFYKNFFRITSKHDFFCDEFNTTYIYYKTNKDLHKCIDMLTMYCDE